MNELKTVLDGLVEDDLDAAPRTKTPAVQHPCGQCGGTGKWVGGRNQRGESKCFACNGKGYFKTSKQDRLKAKVQRQERKDKKIKAARDAFEEQHPGLIAKLQAIGHWNTFANSMLTAIMQYGSLTENQLAATERMLAKVEAREAERAKEKKAGQVEIDLSPIRKMFQAARDSGLSDPRYRAEGLRISFAPENSRNKGYLYVKTVLGDYQGKISPDNVFFPFSTDPKTFEALKAIAANPMEAAIKYGRETKSCSCCGRTLTDPESVKLGIGPICAGKWGF